jgi:TPR repeat protein
MCVVILLCMCLLFAGDGVEERADKGMRLLLDAAHAGDARAMFSAYLRLADAPHAPGGSGAEKGGGGHALGPGGRAQALEARKWLERAAEAGHPKAQVLSLLALLVEKYKY